MDQARVDWAECGLLCHHDALRAKRNKSAGAHRLVGYEDLELVAECLDEVDQAPGRRRVPAIGMQKQ
ncbi:hypothetical protein GCM10023069_69050 [Shinella granuli]